MAKKQQTTSAAESMRLTIEMANNGIIIRDKDYNDDVTLVLTGAGTHKPDGYGYNIDHSEEYRAIGKKVYDWIDNNVRLEQGCEMVVTAFEVVISAKCIGRDYDE